MIQTKSPVTRVMPRLSAEGFPRFSDSRYSIRCTYGVSADFVLSVDPSLMTITWLGDKVWVKMLSSDSAMNLARLYVGRRTETFESVTVGSFCGDSYASGWKYECM